MVVELWQTMAAGRNEAKGEALKIFLKEYRDRDMPETAAGQEQAQQDARVGAEVRALAKKRQEKQVALAATKAEWEKLGQELAVLRRKIQELEVAETTKKKVMGELLVECSKLAKEEQRAVSQMAAGEANPALENIEAEVAKLMGPPIMRVPMNPG
ncbi:hypothetical protein EV174_001897, partial [Coemansia sp. RSA 2320]